MSQITMNYPSIEALVSSMEGTNAQLMSVGSGIASEQASLAANWNGDTGTSYQSWQTQWNSAMEELTGSHRQLKDAIGNNNRTMMMRDQGEGSKWGA